MWELIEQNKRKSLIVFFFMFLLLEVLGISIGIAYSDEKNQLKAMILGGSGAFLLFLVLSIVSYFFGDKIVINSSRATEITKEIYPQLFNIVEEMKIASGMAYMPEIYVVNDDAMNAFSTGIKPQKSAIIVTSGLVENLTRSQLQGVIAHEMAHILNRDVAFMTFAGVMLGSINILSKGLLFSTVSSRRSKLTNSGAKSFLPFFFFSLILSVLAPLLAKIFYFSISKKREYLADATAVRFTRYPEGLASALETIAASGQNLIWFNKITAPMYIVNPEGITPTMDYFETRTHPPLFKRVEILRELQHSNNVSFRNYQSIYTKKFKDYKMIPSSALKDSKTVSTIVPKEEKQSKKKNLREIEDVLLASNGFLFLTCSCGLKIKAPAKMGKSKMQCPRCGKYLILPSVTSTVSHLDEKTKPIKNSTMKYLKKTNGWESFSCKCGHTIQLSPLFKSREITCKKCGTKIEIDYP